MATNDFYTTYNLFKAYTGYEKQLTFDEWDSLPEDNKAAVLYLQFFDQITLAWYKVKKVFSSDCDGVSEILQYLNKNVPVIHDNPKRFTPNYIYKVAYNCLYCVTEKISKHARIYENEISNIVSYGDETLDLFDTVVSGDGFETSFRDSISAEMWAILENKDRDTLSVVAQILGLPSEPGKRYKRVSEERRNEIFKELSVELAQYKQYYM